MSPEQVHATSRQVIRRLMDLPEYAEASCLMLYWSCHNEVHTHDLVRAALGGEKTVLLPRCHVQRRQIIPHRVRDLSRDLVVGAYGILEPNADTPGISDLREVQMCVVPGIAFDPAGHRVGRGLGYYDRFLQRLSPEAMRIGVAHAFQIVSKICPTDGDVRMDIVVTEKETLVPRWR